LTPNELLRTALLALTGKWGLELSKWIDSPRNTAGQALGFWYFWAKPKVQNHAAPTFQVSKTWKRFAEAGQQPGANHRAGRTGAAPANTAGFSKAGYAETRQVGQLRQTLPGSQRGAMRKPGPETWALAVGGAGWAARAKAAGSGARPPCRPNLPGF